MADEQRGRRGSRREARGRGRRAPEGPPRNARRPKPPERVESVAAKPPAGQRWARVRVAVGRIKRPALIGARVLSVCAALVGAVWVGRLVQTHLKTSSAFALERISLEGNQRVSREELLEAAGLQAGMNIFDAPPEQVRARLLAHPWVASVEATRRLPNRYELQVREREAVALLVVEACSEGAALSEDGDGCDDGPASTLYLVGDEGTVFKRLAGEDPIDLPVITGVDRQRLGTDPTLRDTVLLESVALLHEYRAAGLWRRLPIGEIHIEPDGGFSLYVGEELSHVRLGRPPFEKKLRRMRKVFDRLDQEQAKAAYVYLDNERRPDRVTVRLR